MKIIPHLLIIVFAILVSPSVVSAVTSVTSTTTSTPSATNRTQIQKQVQAIKQDGKVAKVRASVGVRSKVFQLAITRTENILDKLQVRIDRAKAAGKDVTALNTLMTDARENIAEAETKLASIDSNVPTVSTRANVKAVVADFKVIKDNLKDAKNDASKIIRALKGFNSATSQGKNSQATGTPSAATVE